MDDWLYRIGLALCLCLVISVGSIIYFVWQDRLYTKSKQFFLAASKTDRRRKQSERIHDTAIEKIRASRFGALRTLGEWPQRSLRAVSNNYYLNNIGLFEYDLQCSPKTPIWDMQRFLRWGLVLPCLLYTSPSPRDQRGSRMPSSA